MNNPKITVITICFNAAKTFGMTIQSIIKQINSKSLLMEHVPTVRLKYCGGKFVIKDVPTDCVAVSVSAKMVKLQCF